MKVLDTTFLIDLMNGDEKAKLISDSKDILLTTQLNMYEIVLGLFLKNLSSSKMFNAMQIFETIKVLPLDDNGIIKSAEICSDLIKSGKQIDDIDCLTAGIALSKGVNTIVTRNVEHFKRIKGIKIETY